MLASRRILPPLHLLSAFEAAARTGGFSTAAQDLNLTQSAISRQIKALEEMLGILLFTREKQKVRLTESGKIYAHQIREALQLIASASLNLQTNPSGGSLNLAILPTFGTRWLAPRLPDFLATSPGITLNLSTRMEPFDFSQENLDAAIHFGLADWPDSDMIYLMSEKVVPACSPAFLEQYNPKTPSQLLEMPLLHLASRPHAWQHWFEQQSLSYTGKGGMIFDQFATAANATLSGLGVALLPTFLIAQELQSGGLVSMFDSVMESSEAYYLVWPKDRAGYPPLIAFQSWISSVSEIRGSDI